MRLKDLREDADLTQAFIAKQFHIRQSTYSQYENGQRQISLRLLIDLAVFYKTSIDYIVGLTDERHPYPYNGYVLTLQMK
ncbi:MAG: helix-turn-helix transcriptional regulator [Clostridia bacterium]|nr:helix-turn-helix transcriptional regulator [Clostridia bacterium]